MTTIVPLILLALVLLFVVVLLGRTVRIIPQARAGIVERFGKYKETLPAGLNVVVPFIDRVAGNGFQVPKEAFLAALDSSRKSVDSAADGNALLTEEARLTKKLFKFAANATDYGDFIRAKRGMGNDAANRLLDHGNYLAYGLGASATWVLGLPHGLAVLHGKTRRGGLVFDVADLVKDAVVLPQAFISASRGDDEQTFRQACINTFTATEALDFMIDTLKGIAQEIGTRAR